MLVMFIHTQRGDEICKAKHTIVQMMGRCAGTLVSICTRVSMIWLLVLGQADSQSPVQNRGTVISSQRSGNASRCYRCDNAVSNEECQKRGAIQECPDGDWGGCQTEVRVYAQGYRLTKKCKADSICLSEVQQFKTYCTGFETPGSICYYCCEQSLCNWCLDESGICNDSYVTLGTNEPHTVTTEGTKEPQSMATEETNEPYTATAETDASILTGETVPFTSLSPTPFHPGNASRCYRCENAASNKECQEQGGIQHCPGGDWGGCQTEVRVHAQGLRLTKKCKAVSVCRSEVQQFKPQCTGFQTPGSICYYCCEQSLCNWCLDESGVCNDSFVTLGTDEPSTTATTETVTSPPAATVAAALGAFIGMVLVLMMAAGFFFFASS